MSANYKKIKLNLVNVNVIVDNDENDVDKSDFKLTAIRSIKFSFCS